VDRFCHSASQRRFTNLTFDGIFGDFQKKHEFATRIKNTSALPRDFMFRGA